MWIAYSNKGTKIEKDFWDWTCMYKVMADYEEEFGITEDEAFARFWEDVKNYDVEDYESCLDGRTFDEALGNGFLDELRADYLHSLDIECEEYKEIFLHTGADLEELENHLSMNNYNFMMNKSNNTLYVYVEELSYVKTILEDRDIIYSAIY